MMANCNFGAFPIANKLQKNNILQTKNKKQITILSKTNQLTIILNNIMAVCVMCNYSLESEYIEEYCRHYFNIGFDHIYLLDDVNGKKERLTDVPYIKDNVINGKITHIELINRTTLGLAYSEFYKKYNNEFEWCCIFDSDEFLVLNKHNNIKEYLHDPSLGFNNADVILVSWVFYGDNGLLHKPKGGIVENFHYNPFIKDNIENKIIIRGGLTNVKFFIGHAAVSNNRLDRIKYSNGTVRNVYNPYIEKPDYTYAELDHYYTKSTEEFIKRKLHGRIDVLNIDSKETLNSVRGVYFLFNEKTLEKEKMFNDAIK